jgi:hypothetical protein
MPLNQTVLVLISLLLAAWTLVAGVAIGWARAGQTRGGGLRYSALC